MKVRSEIPKILIIGSSSVDIVLNTDHIPQPNETLITEKVESFFGGKGANQAVGTARLGSSVYLISSVGMDPKGQQIMRNLVDEGVNVGFVTESEEAPTGAAYVISAHGKSSIVVVPAANFHLRPSHIDEAERLFHTADLILIQLEIPLPTIERAIQLAKENSKKVGIYVSPAKKLPQEIIDYASFIVAKSDELPIIFENESKENILQKYPNKLFVRDDFNSTTFFNGNEMKYFRNDNFGETKDKMGMGDAFNSGFSVAYCHGNDIETCVKFGNDVSLKASYRQGSQSSLPFLKDFEITE